MKKIHTISLTALTVAGLLAAGAGVTYAASNGPQAERPFGNLIEKIATRFGLNADEVQQVFDEERQQMQEERQGDMLARLTERLNQAVTAGTITSAQKDLLLAKHSEIRAFHEILRDMSVADRNAAIKTQTDALKAWATENGIPERLLPMMDGMGERRGQRMGNGQGPGTGVGARMGMGLGMGNR